MTKAKPRTRKRRTPLEQFRLDRDLSYRELADLIARETHTQRTERCIARACQGRRHRATLANAIEKFLKAHQAAEATAPALASEAAQT
jgi:hypothetical protein